MSDRFTAPSVRALKAEGRKIVCVTAYDFPTARLAAEAGVEIILVGDSLGMVVLGYDITLPVTMEDMLHHARAVARAKPRALVVGDMPFMSYQTATDRRGAQRRAAWCRRAAPTRSSSRAARASPRRCGRIVEAGIPVMGHLGLTPQSVLAFGGYRVQGAATRPRRASLREAKLLEACGAFAHRARGHPARAGDGGHRARSPSRPSASAPGPIATARCW